MPKRNNNLSEEFSEYERDVAAAIGERVRAWLKSYS